MITALGVVRIAATAAIIRIVMIQAKPATVQAMLPMPAPERRQGRATRIIAAVAAMALGVVGITAAASIRSPARIQAKPKAKNAIVTVMSAELAAVLKREQELAQGA